MIPHKVLNIRCYICTYLALFFIFVFIRLLEYQILQFHAFFITCLTPLRDGRKKGFIHESQITYFRSGCNDGSYFLQ